LQRRLQPELDTGRKLGLVNAIIDFAGIKTPREAIEGNYVDAKCPFTGNVSIRGRLFK
jgi:hypothetical protein